MRTPALSCAVSPDSTGKLEMRLTTPAWQFSRSWLTCDISSNFLFLFLLFLLFFFFFLGPLTSRLDEKCSSTTPNVEGLGTKKICRIIKRYIIEKIIQFFGRVSWPIIFLCAQMCGRSRMNRKSASVYFLQSRAQAPEPQYPQVVSSHQFAKHAVTTWTSLSSSCSFVGC